MTVTAPNAPANANLMMTCQLDILEIINLSLLTFKSTWLKHLCFSERSILSSMVLDTSVTAFLSTQSRHRKILPLYES